jgi:hypothetical protein
MSPPFLNLLPFSEAITTGLADLELVTLGACPKSARGVTAKANPPATLDCMKRRLFMPHPNMLTQEIQPFSVSLAHAPPDDDVIGKGLVRRVAALHHGALRESR